MRNSLRGRFLIVAVILGAVMALAAHYSETLVRTSYQHSRSALEGFYGLHSLLEEMKKSSEELTALARRAQTGEIAREEWHAVLARTGSAAEQLADDARVREQPHFRGLGDSLLAVMRKLDEEQRASLTQAEELTRNVASLDRLVHLIERRMYDAVIDRTFTALDTSDMLSKLIWGLGATWMAVTLGGFLVFELVIRKPLLGMAHAMEQEGRLGTFDTPLPAPRSQETATLVKAFASMRAQVQSRQERLQSIIDSASDGIIALDEDGVVKNMNPAAEMLFGRDGADTVTLRDLMAGAPVGWPPACECETIVEFGRADGLTMQLSLRFSKYTLQNQAMYMAMVSDVTERQALISKLTVQAERDALTGLHNRRFFTEEVGRAWNRSRRSPDMRMAMIAIDLDHFKFINDTFGHQAGDRLLIEIAQKLRKRQRQGDVIARMGGDEFAILLFEVSEDSVEHVARSYREQIANHPFHADGRSLEIGCSLGVALLDSSVPTQEEWLARADLACRIAKFQGRNRHHLYRAEDEEDGKALRDRRDMGTLVREAVAQRRFQLSYRPITDMRDGVMLWQEAVISMEEGGALLPLSSFMPDLERAGLAAELDRWVIGNAISSPHGNIGITLSAQSLVQRDMVDEIAGVLAQAGRTPNSLTVAMTEPAAVSNPAQARAFVGKLKDIGCATAIDGFGCGYSSFLYLRELPVDFVKLDGETLRKAPTDPLSHAMVRAMRDVAEAMGIRAVKQPGEIAGTQEHALASAAELG